MQYLHELQYGVTLLSIIYQSNMWSEAQRFNFAKSVHLIVVRPMIRITYVQTPLKLHLGQFKPYFQCSKGAITSNTLNARSAQFIHVGPDPGESHVANNENCNLKRQSSRKSFVIISGEVIMCGKISWHVSEKWKTRNYRQQHIKLHITSSIQSSVSTA